MTLAELAKLTGTKQPVIARLKDAGYQGHSLTILQRIADAIRFSVQKRRQNGCALRVRVRKPVAPVNNRHAACQSAPQASSASGSPNSDKHSQRTGPFPTTGFDCATIPVCSPKLCC